MKLNGDWLGLHATAASPFDECKLILDELLASEDSVPFRNLHQAAGLTSIYQRLQCGEYAGNPARFACDVRGIRLFAKSYAANDPAFVDRAVMFCDAFEGMFRARVRLTQEQVLLQASLYCLRKAGLVPVAVGVGLQEVGLDCRTPQGFANQNLVNRLVSNIQPVRPASLLFYCSRMKEAIMSSSDRGLVDIFNASMRDFAALPDEIPLKKYLINMEKMDNVRAQTTLQDVDALLRAHGVRATVAPNPHHNFCLRCLKTGQLLHWYHAPRMHSP